MPSELDSTRMADPVIPLDPDRNIRRLLVRKGQAMEQDDHALRRLPGRADAPHTGQRRRIAVDHGEAATKAGPGSTNASVFTI
jgi:hypothetical protein